VTRPETHRLEDAGGIPNSPLPVLVYHDIDRARAAQDCQALFARNGWLGAWVDGIWDLRRGDPAERDEVLANIAAVPLPDSDPVCGADGPLTEIWRGAA
jgi:uncharacterized protein YjlB